MMDTLGLELDSLPRENMREEEAEQGEQLWAPNWNCFCCSDSGFIKDRLIRLVIPDYRPDKDKLPICNNCTAAARFSGSQIMDSCDTRFSVALCYKLDKINRKCWEDWQKADFQKTIQAKTEEFAANFGR